MEYVRDHESRSCSNLETPKCVNCAGDHPSFSKDCQHYKREAEIKKIKVDDKTTYYNVCNIYCLRNPTSNSDGRHLHIPRTCANTVISKTSAHIPVPSTIIDDNDIDTNIKNLS